MIIFEIISLMVFKLKHFSAHTREKRSFLLNGYSTNETQFNLERDSCTMFENVCLAVALSDAFPAFKLLIPDREYFLSAIIKTINFNDES